VRRLPVLVLALVLLGACGESATPAPSSTSERRTTSAAGTPPDRTDADSGGPGAGSDGHGAGTGSDGRGAGSDAHGESATGAVVVEVVDGDTLVVEVDGARERLRLVGVNAPERGECLAEAAARWLGERVGGREVRLAADRSDRDQYGRLLRYVEVGGADVGAELVGAGLALARRYPPDTGRADEYERRQREAQAAAVGMWAPDACGAPTAGASEVAITEVRFDADGDDNRNLNDEWVRITNEGDRPADLGGFVVKDTSASHRYTVPAGFVLASGASVTVRTGCGADTTTDLHWCREGSAVWNNSGDTAFLLDPAGNVVDSRPA